MVSKKKSFSDLLPVNWSDFGEKFSVRFGSRRTREFRYEDVQI
jgi:hypothetical protein